MTDPTGPKGTGFFVQQRPDDPHHPDRSGKENSERCVEEERKDNNVMQGEGAIAQKRCSRPWEFEFKSSNRIPSPEIFFKKGVSNAKHDGDRKIVAGKTKCRGFFPDD